MAQPTSDEILTALTRADELLEVGCTLAEICRELDISVQTYRVWRKAHSRTFLATAHQVDALRAVNTRLTDVLVDQQGTIQRLEARLRAHELGHSR